MKRKPRLKSENKDKITLCVEYYQPVFEKIFQELHELKYDSKSIHPIRSSYWKLLLRKEYNCLESREYLLQYFSKVETEISSIIRRQSIAYWQHLIRRFPPSPGTLERDEATTYLARSALEAAILKYGKTDRCDRIEYSNRVPNSRICNGILNSSNYKFILDRLANKSQLVLTDFGVKEMLEFQNLFKLSFEIWKCASGLRTIGKGGHIQITQPPEYYIIILSDEASELIEFYDSRGWTNQFMHSASGVVFEQKKRQLEVTDWIFLPRYNLNLVSIDQVTNIIRFFTKKKFIPVVTNFIWSSFNLKYYYQAHKCFSASFHRRHGIRFENIIIIIFAITFFITNAWKKEKIPSGLIHSWQRGYYGPIDTDSLISIIESSLPYAEEYFGLKFDGDVISTIRFLTINETNQNTIDLLTLGPRFIFLPVGYKSFFIDYAYICELLYNLFYNIEPDEPNFKGEALEKYLEYSDMPITNKPLKSKSHLRKQIDFSYDIGKSTLLIAECKAIGKSLAFERGDFEAIEFRNAKIFDALKQADDKAKWLKQNPEGTNYNVTRFRNILPVVVTPFIEYIPSKDRYYWIHKSIPRVLTPSELNELLENDFLRNLVGGALNLVNMD